MRNPTHQSTIERAGAIPVIALFCASILIFLLGAVFSVYSILCDISLPVMNHPIHGAVWGTVIMFLGLRYFFSVRQLKIKVDQSVSGFSWDNFKKKSQ